MGLSHARSDAGRVSTKLVPDNWESTLRQLGLWDGFCDVPDGLRHGFRIGAPDRVHTTYIPNNHKSALDRPHAVQEHILAELAASCYSGPYNKYTLEEAIGPFQCAPLGVVDKASAPGKYRIIQDFSYPRNTPYDSLNSHIDTEAFPCTWGFFSDVAAIVARAPPSSLGATCDVDSAYRQIPVRPADRPHLVIHWDGKFFLDGNVPFGAASSNGLFARCGDAMALILEKSGCSFVRKWVDDFLIIQFPPNPDLPHTITVDFGAIEPIYAIADHLGWPWKLSKTRLFAPVFGYLGFEWDLERKWVSIPDPKRLKYLARVDAWLISTTASLRETEKLIGSLIHCAQALPLGRPRLRATIAFTTTLPHDPKLLFVRKPTTNEARQEAKWWKEALSAPDCGSPITPPPPPNPIKIMSDASTSFGIGVIIGGEWWSWKLLHGWKTEGRDIGWAEAIAMELAVDGVILSGVRDATITCRCDNQGVVQAWDAGRSRNAQQNAVITRILTKAWDANIHINVAYIRSADNIANAPSRRHMPKQLRPASFDIPVPTNVSHLIAKALF